MKKILLISMMLLWGIFAMADNIQDKIEKVVCIDWMGPGDLNGSWFFEASPEITYRAIDGNPTEHCRYILAIQKDKTKVGYAVSGDIITLDKKNRLTKIIHKDTGIVCDTKHETFDIFRKKITRCSNGNKNILYYVDEIVVRDKQYTNGSLNRDIIVGVLQCQETNKKTHEAIYYDLSPLIQTKG